MRLPTPVIYKANRTSSVLSIMGTTTICLFKSNYLHPLYKVTFVRISVDSWEFSQTGISSRIGGPAKRQVGYSRVRTADVGRTLDACPPSHTGLDAATRNALGVACSQRASWAPGGGSTSLLSSSLEQYLPSKDEHGDPAGEVDHRAQRQARQAGNHADGVSHAKPEERDRTDDRCRG